MFLCNCDDFLYIVGECEELELGVRKGNHSLTAVKGRHNYLCAWLEGL